MVKSEECLFCKIIKGEIPSKKIYEDDNSIAFLDINPATEGHTLVVGKQHYANVFDVDEEELKNMSSTVKEVANLLNNELNPEGINVIQNNGQKAGQLVAHIHFHVIPRYEDDQVIIQFPREQAEENELDRVMNKLKYGDTGSKTKSRPKPQPKPQTKAQPQPQPKPSTQAPAQPQPKQMEKGKKEESKKEKKEGKDETEEAIEKDIKEMDL